MDQDKNSFGRERTVLDNAGQIAQIIADRRRELRLNLEDVAKLADVSRHLVSSIEKGDIGSHLEKLLRILDSLQIKFELKKGRIQHIKLPEAPAPKPKPARTRTTPFVPVDQMKTEDGKFICLDCGAEVQNIYMHVKQQHGLGISSYRQRWGIDPSVSFTPLTYKVRK